MSQDFESRAATGDFQDNNSEADESDEEKRDDKVKEKKHDSGAADLQKVTDYAEETEITSSDLSGVSSKIHKRLLNGIY
jgi:hypothetical protein